MNFLGNLWNGITSAVGGVGSAVGSALSQAYQNLTAPIGGPSGVQSGLADIGQFFSGTPTTVASVGPTFPSGATLDKNAVATGGPKVNMAPNTHVYPAGGGTPYYAAPSPSGLQPLPPGSGPSTPAPSAPSTTIGGFSFTPSLGSGAYGGGGGNPGSAAGGYYSNGVRVAPPAQAPSGGTGTGSTIPHGGGGVPAPTSGVSGASGGGTSASLGAGSGIQGGNQLGTVPDQNDQTQNKKTTQTTGSTAPAFIPFTGFGTPNGLSPTTTPQGGTAYKDAGGNIYTQDASGFHLQTSLPAGQGPVLSTADATGKQITVPLTAAPQMVFQGTNADGSAANGGAVYFVQGTDGNGNTTYQYYVKTQNGFQPVSNSNMQGGQTTGQLTGTLGAADSNVQVPNAPNTNVPVGPGAAASNGGSMMPMTLPQFNGGSVGNTVSLSNLTGSGSDTIGSVAEGMASGNLNPQTAQQFETQLSTLQSAITNAMNSQSGIDPGAGYSLDPNEVANGNPGILGAISSDPSNFSAMNAQFGVPQLMKQYVGVLNTANGITAAVSKITTQIMEDPNMPKGLAANQIAFLGNKASIMLAPIQAQASTIKAQLDFAKSQLSLYYSNFYRGANLSLSQFKMAVDSNAIDPTDSAAIQSWAQQLGMQPAQLQSMITFKNLTNLLGVQRTQVGITSTSIQNQANQIIMSLLKDPTTVPSIIAGLQNGIIAPSQLSILPSSGPGAALKTLISTGAVHAGVNLESAQAGLTAQTSAASTANSSGVILPITLIKSIIPNMAELKTISNSINRTSFPAVNSAEFTALLQSGDPGVVKYLTTVTEVADQVAKILQGGGAGGTSDSKLKQAQDLFSTGFSKPQLNAVIDSLTPLLQNRVKALSSIETNFPVGTGPAAAAGSPAAGAPSTPSGNSNNPLGI